MKKLRGFTLIELLIVVAIIAILAAIAVPNFLEAQTRSKVSRAASDMRTLATALEAYFVDNNLYPGMAQQTAAAGTTAVPPGGSAVGTSGTADRGVIPGTGTFFQRGRTFRTQGAQTATAQRFNTLTTPVAYITSYNGDPFADTRGLTFRYHHDRAGWIVGSYGPDTDEAQAGDLPWNDTFLAPTTTNYVNGDMEAAYNSRISQPSVTLITGPNTAIANRGRYTYDPSNGTSSQGDVYRVKN